MQNVSIQGRIGKPLRLLFVWLGALVWLVLAGKGVILITVPSGLRLAGMVAAAASAMGIAMLGTRFWATTPVRHELDKGGLSTYGPDGELRDRTRWTEMREYLIEPIPRTSIRLLRITRTDGRSIRITEGRSPEEMRDFAAFCSHFLRGVGQHQAAPNAAIREGVSFYDQPAMRAIGWIMLVLAAVMVVMLFFLPEDDHSAVSVVAILIGAAPFIYRTVFADRPEKPRPPLRLERAGQGRKFSASPAGQGRFAHLNENQPAAGDPSDD